NLNQKLIHKLIGVNMIKVDTAGSTKTEIAINGVDYRKALALKDALTNTDLAVPEEIDKTEQQDEPFISQPENNATEEKIKIGLPSLIKIGLTRNYLQTLG